MLEVFFCNVGDGDATLFVEHRADAPDYVVLVDAGRPYLEPAEGSLRKEAIYFLKARGVKAIDLLILTHLHIDHIGGAMRILMNVPVKRLVTLTLPPEDAEWVAPSFVSTEKSINGLCCMLNILADLVRIAKARGTTVEFAKAETERLTDRLSLTTILPKADVIERQALVFDALYHGITPEHDLCYRVSKERNQSSLMHCFSYAGRGVLLTGDRYGFDWEDEPVVPCDILKLPHHGDPKSMTPPLLARLHPAFAVISCQNNEKAKKDRPNAEVLAFVQKAVPTVLCTENRAMPTLPAATHNGIRFAIGSDGSIVCSIE